MNILEYENYQEKKSHGNPHFPYNTYLCSIPLDFPQVPLHWHDELEFIYVKKGRGVITIDFLTYPAAAGTIALILPGQLHAIAQYEQETMEYENIIFHPDILISRKTDVCSTDFLSPLFSGARFVPPLYPPDAPHYHEIAACLDANDQICRTMPHGYELFLKSQLFQLFFTLTSRCARSVPTEKNPQALEKIKRILKYVENHYMHKITIAAIAEEAGLSASYFMKYFKHMMGTSFIDYLNDYRLTMASRLLLSSDSSILAIAAETGYENLSYFNRAFKKKFQMTPREYRKNGGCTGNS